MKRNLQSYRRPGLLCLAVGVAASLLTTQVSRAVPYAAQVVKSGTTVNWVLNQDAQGVTIMTNGVAMTTAGATTRGAKSFTLPTADTPYSIIVTGYAAKAWTQFIPDGADRNYYYPNSVAINKNPKSPHFGKVYISNNNLAAPGNTMAGRLTTDGIYVLNADGSALSGPHTGGVNMTIDGSNYSFPYKINWNRDDDCIYMSAYFNDLAYGFNEDFSVLTQLIDASNKTSTSVTNLQYVESVAAKGSRATGNLTLYATDSNYYDANNRGVRAWNIGANAAATPGDIGFQVIGPGGQYGYYPADIEIDSLGNLYTSISRATANQAPDIQKWDGAAALPNTTPLWDAAGKHLEIKGLGVNEAGGTAAAGRYTTSSGQVYFYDINTGAAAGSLDIGNRCRDVAFDVAGNMVSVDNSLEYAKFWSPGGNTTAITKSDGTFQLLQTDTLSVTATDASASETGPDTATFTVTRSGGPNGNLTVSYSLTGTAVSNVDYTISPASPFEFPEGQTSIDITVTPNNDAEREPSETVTLTLAAGGNNYNLAAPTAATATIADNDVSMLFWDTDGSVYGPGGGGSPSGNWTDANWSTSPDGTVATGSYSDWAFPVFSAGIDPLFGYTVTVSGTQYVDGGSFEEGTVTLEGGTLVLTNYDAMKIASGVAVIINSTLAGSSGLTVDNEGTLELGGANIYTGTTTFRTGYVKAATSGVIPDASTLAVRAGAIFDLSYLSTPATETVGGLAGDSGTLVKLYPDITLKVGENNANTTFSGSTGAELPDTDPNYTAGGGTVVKIGTGTLSIGTGGTVADELVISNGIVSINDSTRLAGSAKPIIVDGGIIRSTSAGIAVSMLPTTRPLTIGPAGGTLRLNDATAILFQTTPIGGTGALTKDGPGEMRTYTVAHTFPKLIVKQGMWTGGQATSLALAESFGAIPASPLADAITLDGGAIRKAGGANLFLDPNQGITLGAAGGTIRGYGGNVGAGTFGIPGVISGTGALTVNASGDSAYGPIIVLAGNNTYSGGTTMSVGSCYVTNNGTGSGTGSGAVAVSGGTFGGDGAISGPLNLSGGTLAPGYSFNVGPLPVTAITKAIGKLTLANGLNMTGGTFSWQLGALSTANPGADFDQLAVTGGNISVTAGTLAIAFTGTATAPVDTEPFWQTAKQWKIISLAGGGSATAGFTAITGTNGITAGTFTTTSDATGVNLVWTPAAVTPEPVTGMTVAGVTGGDITINYTGGAGTRLVLLRTFDLTVPISSWERVKTNAPGTGSFVMPVGTDPKAFYVIKSE